MSLKLKPISRSSVRLNKLIISLLLWLVSWSFLQLPVKSGGFTSEYPPCSIYLYSIPNIHWTFGVFLMSLCYFFNWCLCLDTGAHSYTVSFHTMYRRWWGGCERVGRSLSQQCNSLAEATSVGAALVRRCRFCPYFLSNWWNCNALKRTPRPWFSLKTGLFCLLSLLAVFGRSVQQSDPLPCQGIYNKYSLWYF